MTKMCSSESLDFCSTGKKKESGDSPNSFVFMVAGEGLCAGEADAIFSVA
jgi:hypothetical protein